MKVIGAGLPKTGTKTLNSALTALGYNVFDYMENVYLLEEEWKRVFEEGVNTEEFQRMFQNVDAVVDAPSCHFWQELHRAFPDAKIILTIRDDEDTWYDSLKRHFDVAYGNVILRFIAFLSPSYRRNKRYVVDPMLAAIFGIDCPNWKKKFHLNETLLKIKYRSHNADVIQNAEADKLLIYNCSEGWGPLCEFLGVKVPKEPFPVENTGSRFLLKALHNNSVFLKMQREVYVMITGLAFISAGVISICFKRPKFVLNVLDSMWKHVATFVTK